MTNDPNNRDALKNTPQSTATLEKLKENGSADQPRQSVAPSFGARNRNEEPVAKVPSQLAGK
jgi:hypothetical protein